MYLKRYMTCGTNTRLRFTNPNAFVHHRNLPSLKDSGPAEMMHQIDALVARDDKEVKAEWDASEEKDLTLTIAQYRDAIRSLTTEIQNKTTVITTAEQCIEKNNDEETQLPQHAVPILADVRTYKWSQLYTTCHFDVIMMDPPWQLATSNPTRGVTLSYGQLTNKDIINIPINKLQSRGLLFIWVINSSFDFAMSLFEKWDYRIVDEIVWAKLTVNRRLAKSHGYYLQHAKEVCLVGMKRNGPQMQPSMSLTDVILSKRRGQSQKPDEIYHLIEALVPNGKYLEIFARKNNLRDHWVSLGNEVIGVPKHEQTMSSNTAC